LLQIFEQSVYEMEMQSEILKTPSEVIAVLGGVTETGRVAGVTAQTVNNWRGGGERKPRIPAEYHLLIEKELRLMGYRVAPEVFGLKVKASWREMAG
jgi:hypothetical protein